METSVFLAKTIGLFGAISTLAIIIRYKMHLQMEEAAAKDPARIYIPGFLFLMLGVLITVGHPVWTMDWRVIITILGWILLVKGIMRILAPEVVKRMIAEKKNNRSFILGEIITFIISIYLVYQGFLLN